MGSMENRSTGVLGGMLVRKSDLEAIWREQKGPQERPWQDQKEWQSIWEQIETLTDDETCVLVVA
jgi:hypothetical protein